MTIRTICYPSVALLALTIAGACQPDTSGDPGTNRPKADPAAAATTVAPEPPETGRAAASAGEQATAVYHVGQLDGTVIGDLNQALAGRDCVLATRPDEKTGRFEVTYRADLCCPNSLKSLLAEVRPDVQLEGARGAAPTDRVDDQGSCGGCPYKNSCDQGGE